MDLPPAAASLIDKSLLATLGEGVDNAVRRSFEVDRNVDPTRDEIKRRVNICIDLFCKLRGDLDWGVHRIVDHLPKYLRAELDGVAWEPDERAVWLPTDGT